jgi:hypothetical protein
MDAIILKFVGENWMTLYLALTILKGISIITPSVTDNKIYTMFSNVYNSLRTGKVPESLEDK